MKRNQPGVKRNKTLVTLMAVIVILAVAAGILFALNYKKNNQINSNAQLVFWQGRIT